MHSSSRPASAATRPTVSPFPRSQVNTQTHVIDTNHGRILCIADIRGRLGTLNDLAREANAKAVIHTGDFGFFEASSIERINDRTLRHLTMYSPLIPSAQRTHLLAQENPPSVIRSTVNVEILSEFPLLLAGQLKLQVPVYTVWGSCEDVMVLEKFRLGTYVVENLHIIDEATTRCLDIGGIKLRLLGLGGALVHHKLFDNGEGNSTIAGGQGTVWATALQIGELVDTAQRVFDASETRLLVTHASPGREGLIAQLALVLKADLTISGGLHFRYTSSYNDFSVHGDFEGYRHKVMVGKEAFDKVWESVKGQVEAVIDEHQRVLLDKALSVVERLSGSGTSTEEPALKNCWHWNLCDSAYGSLVLDVKESTVSAELKSEGFSFAYRRSATIAPPPTTPATTLTIGNNANSYQSSTKASTPVLEKTHPSNVGNKSTGSAISENVTSRKGSPTPVAKPNGSTEKPKKKKDKMPKEGSQAPKPSSTPEPSTSAMADPGDEVKSPTDASSGIRTPRSKPARNPWTIFLRMPSQATEAEQEVTDDDLRAFFGDAKDGIIHIHYPTPIPNRQRIIYVEFADEEAMKAGLEKHVEKLNSMVVEVKQAIDRGEQSYRGYGVRGRGRRGGGGFAARGLTAAGLTRGHGNRNSGGVDSASGSPMGDGAKNKAEGDGA